MTSDTEGLVGWWPLHSDRPVDLSGFDNHGNASGVTSGVAGRGGLTGYSFDGSSSNVDIPGFASTISNATEYTANFWAKDLVGTGGAGIYHSWDGGGSVRQHTLDLPDDNTFSVWIDGDERLNGNTDINSITSNSWKMFTVTMKAGGDINIYADTDLIDSSSNGTQIPSADQQTRLMGRSGESNRISGNLFDLRFYNKILSSAEIQTLYEWGSGDYAKPPADGVSYYPLDGSASDQWSSNNGTVNGATVTNDSVRGQAYSFDASNSEYINVDSNLTSSSSWTCSAWIKWDGTSGNQAIVHDDTNNLYYLLKNDSDNIVVFDGSHLAPVSAVSGSWMHYTSVHNGSELYIYENGSLANSLTTNISSLEGISSIGLNDSSGSQYFDGNIDDVRLYDYALTPQEVHDLYRWGTFGRDMRKFTVKA
jgi:hypothetical protein